MLRPEELPAPETLIDYGDGGFGAAMFHYSATETDDIIAIAHEHGFDIAFMSLEDDVGAESLLERNGEGENVLAEWNPEVPSGWLLGGKWDTEDGPVAVFLRQQETTRVRPTVDDVGHA